MLVSVDHLDTDHITSEPEQHSPLEGDTEQDTAPPPLGSHQRGRDTSLPTDMALLTLSRLLLF